MTPPTRVVLLRHFDRPLDRCGQHTDLLPRGRERAEALPGDMGLEAPPPRPRLRILCSPFRRCMQSVAPLARRAAAAAGLGGRAEVVVDWDLSEHPRTEDIDDEAAHRDAFRCFGDRAELAFRPRDLPLRESPRQLRERCERFVRRLRRERERAGGALTVICSHQSTLQRVLAAASDGGECVHRFAHMGDMVRLDLV